MINRVDFHVLKAMIASYLSRHGVGKDAYLAYKGSKRAYSLSVVICYHISLEGLLVVALYYSRSAALSIVT